MCDYIINFHVAKQNYQTVPPKVVANLDLWICQKSDLLFVSDFRKRRQYIEDIAVFQDCLSWYVTNHFVLLPEKVILKATWKQRIGSWLTICCITCKTYRTINEKLFS